METKQHNLEQMISLYKEAGDKQQAVKMAAYMRGQFAFLGLPAPLRNELNKALLNAENAPSIENLEWFVWRLWEQKEREFQYLAINLIHRQKHLLLPSHIDFLVEILTHKSWWDTVDLIAPNFVGLLLEKYPELLDEYLPQWVESTNIWLNRTALIFQLRYGEKTDFELLKEIIEPLKTKDDFFVKKAIGWALRNYSKYEARQVEDYIKGANLKNLSAKEGLKRIKNNSI